MNALNSKRAWVDVMDDTQVSAGKKSKGKSAGSGSSRESSNSRKKSKSHRGDGESKACSKKPLTVETDPLVLQRRQKQIDYGKNTVGYHNYVSQVPLDQRTKEHPKTPDKYAKYSRRSWDTLIKMWRKKLHEYDANATSETCKENDDDDGVDDDDDDDEED